MAANVTQLEGPRIKSRPGLELALPRNERSLGAVIRGPQDENLIEGVKVEAFAVHPDDRGYFLEVHRMGFGAAAAFPAETTQISAAFNHPGTIKAFHYHLHQTDYWTIVRGLMQVALADLRVGSPTYGRRNTMYVGPLRPWRVLIPPGVAHGYKVIGAEEAMLVYLTDRFYNPEDEGRIPYDDPGIHYDWDTQRK